MKWFLLIVLSLVSLISILILILTLKYIDPFTANKWILISLIISFVLLISSVLALIFYFIKKIHYRWEVLVNHIISSLRQWFFIAIFFVWLAIFERIGVPIYLSWFLLFILIFFLELFIQNIYW